MNRPIVMIGILAGALVLSGCGKVETLDQPAPLWGEKAKADYQARKAARAAAKTEKKDDGDPEVLPDVKYDPNADPGPQRLLPIPGTNPSPNDPGQPGVLPDPMNNPGPNAGPG
jgi:hypothetical protein